MHKNPQSDSRSLRVAVTGANGFVGRELTRQLLAKGHAVTGIVRNRVELPELDGLPYTQQVGEITSSLDWEKALKGIDVIYHLAARVHRMKEHSNDALAIYRKENVELTEMLAKAASTSGVRRFIFLSSVKVNGESTCGRPIQAADKPNPGDPYAISKYEAEQAILKIASNTTLESVIFRPPLIYGPGVKANFLRMLKWVDKGVPLPLTLVKNRRSMIYLGNLVDALLLAASHPAVVNKTYLVSDGEDISTPMLISEIAAALGKKAYMWPLPEYLLRFMAALAGKQQEAERLLGSLQVDSSDFCKDTGWVPPYTLTQGISKTVGWYLGELQ